MIVDSDAGEARAFGALEKATGSGTELADFNFDPDSGVLSFQGATSNAVSSLIIRATSGTTSGTRSAMLAITVRRDFLPAFTTTEFDLPENSDPPQVMLSATDANDETVTLALGNELDGALFTLEDSSSVGGTTTANLRFMAQPDFENPMDTVIATPAFTDPGGDNIYQVSLTASSSDFAGNPTLLTRTH